MVSIDILTDLNECCSAIIERSATRRSPPSLSLNLSQAESYYSSPSGTWCNSRTNSPTMLRTFFKEEPSTNTNSNSNNLSLEWSRTNSPIEECSRTNSPISTTHNNSGKESRSNNSHIFSFSSQKKISSTWNYSRNSSPTGNQQTYFFDEGIVDEIGKRRRGSGIIRMERLLNDDDMGDVIFSLQKLKENLHIAERRLSIK